MNTRPPFQQIYRPVALLPVSVTARSEFFKKYSDIPNDQRLRFTDRDIAFIETAGFSRFAMAKTSVDTLIALAGSGIQPKALESAQLDRNPGRLEDLAAVLNAYKPSPEVLAQFSSESLVLCSGLNSPVCREYILKVGPEKAFECLQKCSSLRLQDIILLFKRMSDGFPMGVLLFRKDGKLFWRAQSHVYQLLRDKLLPEDLAKLTRQNLAYTVHALEQIDAEAVKQLGVDVIHECHAARLKLETLSVLKLEDLIALFAIPPSIRKKNIDNCLRLMSQGFRFNTILRCCELADLSIRDLASLRKDALDKLLDFTQEELVNSGKAYCMLMKSGYAFADIEPFFVALRDSSAMEHPVEALLSIALKYNKQHEILSKFTPAGILLSRFEFQSQKFARLSQAARIYWASAPFPNYETAQYIVTTLERRGISVLEKIARQQYSLTQDHLSKLCPESYCRLALLLPLPQYLLKLLPGFELRRLLLSGLSFDALTFLLGQPGGGYRKGGKAGLVQLLAMVPRKDTLLKFSGRQVRDLMDALHCSPGALRNASWLDNDRMIKQASQKARQKRMISKT